MATRLYPKTRNRAALAHLAGVPEEAWERLDHFEQQELELLERLELGEIDAQAHYAAVQHLLGERFLDEQVNRLEDFLLLGWGHPDTGLLQQLGLDPDCGTTDDPGQVRCILEGHRIYLYGLEVEVLGGLTQHPATPEQVTAGVVEPADKRRVQELLTFGELPTTPEVRARGEALAEIAFREGAEAAMIGGAPYLMRPLEEALAQRGVQPLYAFSVRESVEVVVDGGVEKRSVFRHVGFVEGG